MYLKATCHLINFLLTSLAQYSQKKIIPRSFLYKPRHKDLGLFQGELGLIIFCTDLVFGYTNLVIQEGVDG